MSKPIKRKYKSVGIILKDDDAQIIGSFIEKRFPLGTNSPQALVEAARPKNSEIHDYFEWDNDAAADKYRLYQARNILLSITIETEAGDVRAFHNISLGSPNDRMYYSFDKAVSDVNLWNEIIQSALREAQQWQKKYRVYKELALISEAIEQTTERIQKKRS